jgi:hypothetical protein
MLEKIRSSLRRASEPSVAKFVLAHQPDGLGERLNALLNAMRVSELLGVDYRFTWPMWLAKDPHHAIVPADEVFTAEFLAAHLIDADAKDRFEMVAGPADDLDSLHAQLEASELGLRVPARPLDTRINPEAVPAITRGFAEEFDAVGFHPQILAAIKAARSVPLGEGSVGLHLRAGDILFGKYRTRTHSWYKIVSPPVARTLIERSRSGGRDVLVFGQDAELIGELCASTGAIDASAIRASHDLSRTGEAIFDLVLLSRCERIIAGHSGFAIQAASIAGSSVDNHLDLIPPEEVIELTRDDMARNGDRYDVVHREFAWWAAFYGARHQLDYATATELLTAAFTTDPSNPRARLHLAALHYAHGKPELGDDLLVDALLADLDIGGKTLASVLLFSLITVRGYDSREILDDITDAAEAGSGPATLYRAALQAQRADADGAARDVATFRAYAAGDARLADLDQLDAMIDPTIQRRLDRAGRTG